MAATSLICQQILSYNRVKWSVQCLTYISIPSMSIALEVMRGSLKNLAANFTQPSYFPYLNKVALLAFSIHRTFIKDQT